ncbi:MAG: LamG domain-containing protein, partial [Anaerolineae bacterium]|nr:LamG domain-containing protein [Anaerolineae bacterium]
WFKHSSNISGTDYLLANFNDAGYKIYMTSAGALCLGIDDDSTWGPDDSTCTPYAYNDSRWHHFAAIKSGTASITMYIDGLQASQNASLSATSSLNTDSSLYIGNDTDGGSNGWVGFLDQIVVYNYARSAAQVKVDHNGGTANFGP